MRAPKLAFVSIVLFAMICICLQKPQLAQVVQQSSKKDSDPPPIRLVLRTTKHDYRVGEPVMITALSRFLRKTGNPPPDCER